MTKKELLELIRSVIREYTGTGSFSKNAGDGNNVTSPRPFADDGDEIENYINKNIYGAEGGHFNKDTVGINPPPGRTPFTKF